MLRINSVCLLGLLVSSVGATVQDVNAYVLSIQPPTSLTLIDGANGSVNITAGNFNLTGLIGYSQLQPNGFTILDPLSAADDIVRQAEINSGVKMGLIEVDPEFEVLHFSGFFSSTSLVNDAYFEGIVGVIGPDGPEDFTIFLPTDLTQPLQTQLSSLETNSNADNIDVFVDVASLNTPTIEIAPTIGQLTPGVEVFTLTGDPANGRPDWFLGIGGTTDPGGASGGGGSATLNAASANMSVHGTILFGGCIPGSLCTAVWNGGAGNWNTPGAWDIGLVPFNGNFSGTTFNAVIDGGAGGSSDVTLSNTVSIVGLTVTSGDSLTIDPSGSLTVEGGAIINAGTINITGNPSFGTATLATANSSTTTLSGGGSIVLTHPTQSRLGTSANQAIINQDNTIRGAGTINASVTNQGTVRAENGKLSINATVDNTAGVIEVALNGDLAVIRIIGGDLNAHALSTVTGTLQDVTNTGDLTIQDAVSLNFEGSLTNPNTLTILGDPSFGTSTFGIPFGNTVTLDGGGEVVLTHDTQSRIGTSANQTLNNVDNTIRGHGTVNAQITNGGTIRAEAGKLTLNAAVDNSTGAIEIAADGVLGGSAVITGGTVIAVDGSVLMGPTLASALISGDLDAATSGLTDATLELLSTIDILDASTLTVAGSFTNRGVVSILGSPTFGTATFGIPSSSTTVLDGGGEVVLTNATYSRIGTSANQTLDNVDNTIRGAGNVNATIINRSTVRAEGGVLTINTQVDNTLGLIQVAADGTLNATGTIVGGTLTSDPLGSVRGTFQNVTNTGPLAIRDATTITFEQGLTNQGVVTVFGSPTFGTATFGIPSSSTTVLDGGGEVVLTNATYSRIGTSANQTLDNVDNTIRGAGNVNATIINRSTVRAEGGTLTINTELDNTTGLLDIAAGAELNALGTIVGGTLTSDPAGAVRGTLRNVTSPSPLTIANGTTLTLDTAFTNQGSVTVLGDPSFGTATFGIPSSSTTVLNGGGEVVLTNATYSRIGTSANQVLDNVDNTIRGQGAVNAQVINRSTVRAEGGTLTINTQMDNTLGLIQVAADGTLNATGTIVGGTLASDPLGSVRGRLQNVTNTGPLAIRDGTTITFEQGLSNQGVVTVIGSPSLGTATFGIPSSSTTVLDGGGEVVLTNATYSRIGTSANQVLDNVDNTIRGQGTINAKLINGSTLRAEGGTLTINADVTGTGDTFVDAGATLVFNAGTLQQQTLTVDPAGTFDFNGTRLEVVDFTGDFVQDSGTYAPGSSPAESTLNGGYQLASNNATLEIEIGGTALGEFDQLTVSGAVNLNGKLSIVSLPSYVPSAGDTFVVLKALGGLTGDFTAINGQIIGEGPGPGYQIILDYTSGTVTLQTTLPGDLNGDGFVGIADLNLVLGNWNLNVPPGDPLADPSGDGFVGIADLNVVLGNWNGDFPPTTGAAAIPEPGTVGLVGLGVAALARHRARRGA